MKIFLDTANLADIQWALATGLIDGVTTNPTLLADELSEREARGYVADLCRIVPGPVTVQVTTVDTEGMYREGKELARLADNLIVELPLIEEGLVALRRLVADGIRVNATLVFSAAQALLAAKAGARYVSPFVGRLDDSGGDGVALVSDVRQLFDRFGLECEILAASIRTPRRFLEVAKGGADAVAVPPRVLRALLLHPLTDVGLDEFLNDWSRRIARSRVEA
jgi:transaldolase